MSLPPLPHSDTFCGMNIFPLVDLSVLPSIPLSVWYTAPAPDLTHKMVGPLCLPLSSHLQSWRPLTLPSVSPTVSSNSLGLCFWLFISRSHHHLGIYGWLSHLSSPLRLRKLALSDSLLPPSTERRASARLQHETRQESTKSIFRSDIAHEQS